MESVFCREALRLAREHPGSIPIERWIEFNVRLSARKLARESRMGSIVLGRNFLATVAALQDIPALTNLLAGINGGLEPCRTATHYCVAFGLVAGLLEFDEQRTIITFLHQSLASMVSGCQRLMPLGQTGAARILWNLKPQVIDTAEQCVAYNSDTVACFMPLLECGAMEHPALRTRLFVS